MPGIPDGSNVFDHIWILYTEPLKERIREQAQKVAKEDGREEPTAADVFDAIRLYLPGHPVEVTIGRAKEAGWFSKNINGFIGITASLAVSFGVIGLVPAFISHVSPDYVKITSGFIEISKIFAGALVGGAAGAAATTASRR